MISACFECGSICPDFLALVRFMHVLLNYVKYISNMLNDFKNIYTNKVSKILEAFIYYIFTYELNDIASYAYYNNN